MSQQDSAETTRREHERTPWWGRSAQAMESHRTCHEYSVFYIQIRTSYIAQSGSELCMASTSLDDCLASLSHAHTTLLSISYIDPLLLLLNSHD
jgi:hypothetical protein